MRLPLAVVLLSLLDGCATAPGATGRPSTLSDLLLALDAAERMWAAIRTVGVVA